MKHWDKETGDYVGPSPHLDVNGKKSDFPEFILDQKEYIGKPDEWLSKPGGDYQIGISFHYPPYTFAEGGGIFRDRYFYKPAPFFLNAQQDPFNSWGVRAKLAKRFSPTTNEYWDWYPGVMIIDSSRRYTLPSEKLAFYSGCEWADNDFRIFHGLESNELFDELVHSSLEVINRVAGPGWASWPFGQRQLAESVIIWISPNSEIPELLLLASVKQHGVKFASLDREFYYPGDTLGIWENMVDSWDCRQALKFFYQSKLLLHDGLPEMALSCAIASLENASAEVLSFLVNGDKKVVEKEFYYASFLDRFDRVLPKYSATIPRNLFEKLKKAYFARNGIVHGLRPVTLDKASEYLNTIESVLKWYWLNIGNGHQINKKSEDYYPF